MNPHSRILELVEENETLRAEVERLTKERDQAYEGEMSARAEVERLGINEMDCRTLRAENERLQGIADEYAAETAKLRETLSFYAEYDNYRESYISGERLMSEVEKDCGDKARELAKLRNEQIDRDQKEIERLREALEWAMERLDDPFIQTEGAKIARAALQSKGE
jgi:hypothetical protein